MFVDLIDAECLVEKIALAKGWLLGYNPLVG